MIEFGCGQCLPCRINRERLWTARILLEAGEHGEKNAFATLSYAEEHVPPELNPRHLQLWLKRFREAYGQFRYFAVGEYGDKGLRPHYHAMLFGVSLPAHVNPPKKVPKDWRLVCACVLCRSWDQGLCHVGTVAPESAAYIAGYTVKGLTNGKDEFVMDNLGGRHPEFVRMSLKPGIGALAADRIAQFYTSRTGSALLARDGDVSGVVRQEKQFWPLGRYLTGRVKQNAGVVVKPLDRFIRGRIKPSARYAQRISEMRTPGFIEAREGRRERSAIRAVARVKYRQQKGGKS